VGRVGPWQRLGVGRDSYTSETRSCSSLTMHPMSDEQLNKLLKEARKAKRFFRAPYSRFPVGAAVRLQDGTIITGANVENASYGLTCCAERIAIFKAVTSSANNIVALAVSCGKRPSRLAPSERMPCGACLQVMVEFMQLNSPIVVDGMAIYTLRKLLPHSFMLRKKNR